MRITSLKSLRDSCICFRQPAITAYANGMSRFVGYYSRFNGVRNDLTGLPPWARTIFFLSAIPGIVLVGLSILLLAVSVAALLLLAIPVYALLRSMTGTSQESEGAVVYDPDP